MPQPCGLASLRLIEKSETHQSDAAKQIGKDKLRLV